MSNRQYSEEEKQAVRDRLKQVFAKPDPLHIQRLSQN